MNPRRIHQTGAAVLLSQWEKEGSGGEEGRKLAEKGEEGPYPASELSATYPPCAKQEANLISDLEF